VSILARSRFAASSAIRLCGSWASLCWVATAATSARLNCSRITRSTLDIDAGTAEAISVILLVSGIPGAFIGGWLTDRALGAVPTFLAALVLEAIAFLLIPYLGLYGVEIAAAIIGAAGIATFVPFVTIPGQQGSVFIFPISPWRSGSC